MLKIAFFTILLALYSWTCHGQSGIRTLLEMQERVWISQSDLTMLLLAAGTPKCMQPCITGLVDAASEALKFNDTIVTGFEKLCKEYKGAKTCVMTTKCGNRTVFNILTKGLQAACGENFHLIYLVKPCLEFSAKDVLQNCDSKCDLSIVLEQLAQSEQIKKLVDRGGNPMALLRHLGPTCSSMTCFLSCAHIGLNQKCPITGSAFVEVSLKPLEEVAQKLKNAPPSLKKIIKKKLPTQCQPLLDIDYLNRLKLFGALPDEKPESS